MLLCHTLHDHQIQDQHIHSDEGVHCILHRVVEVLGADLDSPVEVGHVVDLGKDNLWAPCFFDYLSRAVRSHQLQLLGHHIDLDCLCYQLSLVWFAEGLQRPS